MANRLNSGANPSDGSTRETQCIATTAMGTTQEWHAQAAKRGLPNLKTSIEALPVFEKSEVVKLFDKYGILTPRELKSTIPSFPRTIYQDRPGGREARHAHRDSLPFFWLLLS